MNKAENEAGNKAVDSLINYETVKVTNIHTCCLFCLQQFKGFICKAWTKKGAPNTAATWLALLLDILGVPGLKI